ncbi:MAG TPA: hypothetical protein VK897_25780 [Anaerolineales bacterium]|nr:hypothetical protein [Anaerolineales bacterium]
MNIQEAIKSGKPFRREGWVDDDIYVVYVENDIVLTLETDFSTSIDLDIQDILADDWYTRDSFTDGHTQMRRISQANHLPVDKLSFPSILKTQRYA